MRPGLGRRPWLLAIPLALLAVTVWAQQLSQRQWQFLVDVVTPTRFSAPNGSASAPTYGFDNCTDCGMYSASSDRVRISVSGKNAATFIGTGSGEGAIQIGGWSWDDPSPSFVNGANRAAGNTNLSGGGLSLSPGLGTGNAAPACLAIQGAVRGASGTTAQAATTRLSVCETESVFMLDHLRIGGSTAPAISACGTSPTITGVDAAGIVVTGSGAALQSCTLTFNVAHSSSPACFVNNQTTILAVRAVANATTLTFDCAVAGCLESETLTYFCIQPF